MYFEHICHDLYVTHETILPFFVIKQTLIAMYTLFLCKSGGHHGQKKGQLWPAKIQTNKIETASYV